jgi:hypothetical protein
MALKRSHMLSTSLLQAAPAAAPASSALIMREAPKGFDLGPEEPSLDDASAPAARRTRIWEFSVNLHCSIVGTCLTTAELRHIVDKVKAGAAVIASDHDLHMCGVMLASHRETGAKFLQKALDRRHRTAIARFAKAPDAAAVLALWDEALKQGDIPGAYWAALTHPETTEDVIKRVFGDVHMLSHLVGAANRADIRRLRQLEADNAALAAKLQRQQRQLHDGFAARDETIRRLNEMLARRAAERSEDTAAQPDDAATVDRLIRDLDRRLARETARRERNEQRVRELVARGRAHDAERQGHAAAMQELEVAERHLAALARPNGGDEAPDLAGLTVLYVGGRAHQVPLLKGLVERAGASFLHHDGGIEHSSTLLPGLIGRADRVLFPIDCISHEAVAAIKRLCRQTGKSYDPLRTASLATLLAALTRMAAARTRVAAE